MRVTPEQLRAAEEQIDQADLDCLEDLVLRIRTADELNALYGDAELAVDAEVGAEALREFRDDGGRGAAGDDGADVEHPAVSAAGSR